MPKTVPRPLSGRQVLVVEDRYLIAAELADLLHGLGADVLGPARDLATAAELLRDERPDVALLDVNLDGEMAFPLAETLVGDGAPIVLLTGYEEDTLPPRWRNTPRLAKPVDSKMLSETLVRAIRAGGS